MPDSKNIARDNLVKLVTASKMDLAPDRRCLHFSSPAHINAEGSGRVIEIRSNDAVQVIGISSQFASQPMIRPPP